MDSYTSPQFCKQRDFNFDFNWEMDVQSQNSNDYDQDYHGKDT